MATQASHRWDYDYGDFTSRRLLHHQFGGSLMTGIAVSPASSHVLLFSRGGASGIGWRNDGFYYYEGAAASGTGSLYNEAVEKAWSRGWRLRLLEAPRCERRGLYRFVDSFVLDDAVEEGHRNSQEGGLLRYPVFRLRSVDSFTRHPDVMTPPGDPRYVHVRRVERSDLLHRDTRSKSLDHERPETRLSKSFERFLIRQGYAVHRLAIHHTPSRPPMLTDIWIAQLSLLIEAKAGRNPVDDVRYALGQLGHYTRRLPGVLRRAVLLSEDPGQDLRETALYMGADLIWHDGIQWCTTGEWGRIAGLKQWHV
ncbi:hypothetical protein GCM10010400_27230 [Streptomyces aculeolatus]|uniref:hypothetical protein n=1 Tax=Streptomyces aculeolatus TaxID=270689 RepID=UPI001CED3F41|nr:hypothetical protein [Streptomyces aculeolatus]